MKLSRLLIAALLVSACGGRKIDADRARKAITSLPKVVFAKDEVEVIKIVQIGGSDAVVEAKLRTAFKLEKTKNGWVAKEVRIGGQWEKVSNLQQALEAVRIEETREMLERIAGAIIKYRDTKGSLPVFKDYVSLSDLLTPSYLSPLIRLDAWNRPLEAVRRDSNSILLRSSGPDGTPGTPDDLSKIVP
jgi:hypothetical protein